MLDNVLIRASLLRKAMPAQSGKLKKTVEFENFISEHECPINHTGSAGSMEAKGVVECFQSSVENRKLQYTKLIGDGNTHINCYSWPISRSKSEKVRMYWSHTKELDRDFVSSVVHIKGL